MRATSVFVASICALFAVASATQEAQQASVHIRVGAVDRYEEHGAVAAAAVVPAASEDATLKTKSKSHHHSHLRELNKCRSLVNEKFKYDIVTTCAVRGAGFNFYYQLKDGTIMRNCMCESFNNGVLDVDLGKVVASKFNLQCYSKDAKKTNAALKDTFDHRSITCAPWDFEEL